MALLAPSSDYTDRDFDSLHARARDLISQAFPNWTDDTVANFGNILVDLFCFLEDVGGKYQDAQARETRWSTATQLKNILSLCKMIGFVPQGATAAQATETFTLAVPMPAPVVLARGQKVFTRDIANPIGYQLLEPLTIAAGLTQVTATVENSDFQEDVFDSSGGPSQAITLSKIPYLDATASVVAANGAYVQVKNFLASTSTDRHYTVFVDSTGRARITFGSGISGQLPAGTVTVDYKTGGGTAGRVDAGQLTSLPGVFTDNIGGLASITVTNVAASSAPKDRATVAQIQVLAPLDVRVSDRTVAREDYEIVALQVAGVSRALMLTSNEDPSVQENSGFLWLVGPGSTAVPQSTLDAVLAAFVSRPYPNTFRLFVRPASFLDVSIQVTAFRRKGITTAQLKTNVTKALADLFADVIPRLDPYGNVNRDAGKPNPEVDFGFARKDVDGLPSPLFPFSDVFTAVKEAVGVLRIDPGPTGFLLNGARADITIERRQFPRLGSVTIIDGDSGAQL